MEMYDYDASMMKLIKCEIDDKKKNKMKMHDQKAIIWFE